MLEHEVVRVETRVHLVGGSYLSLFVINHDVVRLNISVHYSLAVAEIQRLQQLVDVVADIVVLELWVQVAEVGVVDVLEH